MIIILAASVAGILATAALYDHFTGVPAQDRRLPLESAAEHRERMIAMHHERILGESLVDLTVHRAVVAERAAAVASVTDISEYRAYRRELGGGRAA